MFTTLAGRALGVSKAEKKQVLALQARSWFFGDSDFEWWCEAAGYDPNIVQNKARQIVNQTASLKPGALTKWWTPKEFDVLIKQKEVGTSSTEVAHLLGRSAASVNRMFLKIRMEREHAPRSSAAAPATTLERFGDVR